MKEKKLVKLIFTAILLLIFTSGAVLAGSVPELPHVVHGNNVLTSEGGETYSGTVYAVKNGEIFGSAPVEDGVFRDMLVQNLKGGDIFHLRLDGSYTGFYLEYESGKVETIEETIYAEEFLIKAVISVSSSNIETGDTVFFDGSGSSGTNNITSYEWDFGTGETDTGMTVERSFNDPGTYEIQLTVKDNFNNQDTDSVTITVTESEEEEQASVRRATTDNGVDNDEDEETEDANYEIWFDEETGESSIDYESSEDQMVFINLHYTDGFIVEPSRLDRISFKSLVSQTRSVNVRLVHRDDVDVPILDSHILFYEISVEGDIEDSKILFSVMKDFLEERNTNPENVYLEVYDRDLGEWRKLETSLYGETVSQYIFEAELVPGTALYASSLDIEVEEIIESDIRITNLEVELETNTAPADGIIILDLENTGNSQGERTITIEVIKDGSLQDFYLRDVMLESGESTKIEIEHTFVEPGDYLVSANNVDTTVEIHESDQETIDEIQAGIIGMITQNPTATLLGAIFLLLIVGIVIYGWKKR